MTLKTVLNFDKARFNTISVKQKPSGTVFGNSNSKTEHSVTYM